MVRIQHDDRDALGLLYDRYAVRALRFASHLCHQPDTADDIVQEAFISIWKSRAMYTPTGGNVGAWTMGIVRNRAIDAVRRHRVHARRRGDAEALDRHASAQDVANDASVRADAKEVRELLMRLPDAQREVITLAFYGQLTHTEIAERLALPAGTVKGRMRLGLRKLRDDL